MLFTIIGICPSCYQKGKSVEQEILFYHIDDMKKDIDGQTTKSVQSKMASFGCKCTIRNPQGVCCQKDIKHSLTAQRNMLSFTSNTPLN